MVDLKELGNRLQQLRVREGITQKQLAAELHVTQSAISRLENGEEVYATMLLAVLQHYNVSLDYLFSADFDIASDSLYSTLADSRCLLSRHLEIVREAIKSSNEVCLQQLDYLQDKITEKSKS